MADAPLQPGQWVRIHRVELAPAERAQGIPEDTAQAPFEAWTNGWLTGPASLGERAQIRTATGRLVEGRLVAVDPGYDHSFGSPPPELQRAGAKARARLFTGEER